MSAIAVKNISFAYQNPVLKQVSLEVDLGALIPIIGPNGGGKTTFLKLLMGFLTPQEGSIELFGLPPKKQRSLIGYVPQAHSVDPLFPISLLDVVLMGKLNQLNAFGRYRSEDLDHAHALLKTFELSDKAHMPFASLSGGQKQRGLFARALISDPKLLLLDEPTANIDAKAKELTENTLNQLKGKTTILMVTHDFNLFVNQAEWILCLNQTSEILKPEDVCSHYHRGLYHRGNL